jgi:hypothetical protein
MTRNVMRQDPRCAMTLNRILSWLPFRRFFASRYRYANAMPDMTIFGYHPYSAYSIGVPPQIIATAVGWLATRAPRKGAIPPDVLEALRHFHRYHVTDEACLGDHDCGLCLEHYDRGEFLVFIPPETYYVLPRMVLHYIEEHGYCPPKKFLDDLRELWFSESGQSCRSGKCDAVTEPGLKSRQEAVFRGIERNLDKLIETDKSALEQQGVTVTDASSRTHHCKNEWFPSWSYRFESRRMHRSSEIALVTVCITFEQPIHTDSPQNVSVWLQSEIFEDGQFSRWQRTKEESLPIVKLVELGITEVVVKKIEEGNEELNRK